jgi:hypothetical protein
MREKYFRLRSLLFPIFSFLFFLLCFVSVAAETEDLYEEPRDEVPRDEVPEIVVYGEGFIPLDSDAFIYVLTDTRMMRPIIDIVPVNQLKSWQAAQVIDRTEIALAAIFANDTGRFFQIVGFGSYPMLIINAALAIDRNWRFLFSEGDRYWYSEKDKLSVSLGSDEVNIVGWRRSRVKAAYEEPGVKTPEGFIAFRHSSGEPAPLSLWLENRDSILDRMFNSEGITANLPIERLYLNLYLVENNLYKAEIMLHAGSSFPQANFEMNFSEPESGEPESNSALKTLFFANLPVQNDRNIEFQPVLLSEEEIASLLKIFMKNWK